VIEQHCRVLVTHAVERHGAVDVRVVAADNVAGRNINVVIALVCQQADNAIVLVQLDGWPAGEEDAALELDVSKVLSRA
jgi:hypothetical protein